MKVERINKRYEGLEKNSFAEYAQIMEDMNTAVKVMYISIDNGIDKYRKIFLHNYNDWQKLKKLILRNPYNDCGHKLSQEIEKAYNYIIDTYRKELYFTF